MWASTFGGFALVVVYLLMSIGAFRGLAGHGNMAGVYIAAIVGIALTGAAIYGSFYKQTSPTVLAPWFALAWFAIGIVVTFAMKGRPPASEVLADLRSEQGLGRASSAYHRRMTEERQLRLDASREEALEHAAGLVAEAWRSFDRFRPEEPPLDERVLRLLGDALPEEPTPAHEALDDAARILDESIAQARPRYFAFIGSSGLEIGALADFLAHTYDINLAVDARAATQVEDQAVRWVAEFIGFPATGGAFTSGGTISNVSALAAARERALPGSRHAGLGGRRVAVYCSEEVHYSVTRAVELLGIGSDNLHTIPLDGLRRMRPEALAEAIDADVAAGVIPVAVVATAGTTLTGAIDPIDAIADVCAARGVWLHVDGAYGLPAAAVGVPRHGLRRVRARRLLLDRRPQVALPAEGVRRRAREGRRRARGRVRARAGLPAAPAARAARGRHHARVLAAVPRAEAVARVPRARGARSSATRSTATSRRPSSSTATRSSPRTSR